MIRTLRALALVAAALPLPALASPLDAPTSFVVFGDSLSDPGNLFKLAGIPGAPYVGGRFSNGPVWAETVAADFTAQGLFSANFAFGGANAVENFDGVPDFGTQIGLFESTVPDALLGTSPLAAVWFGGNDLFDAFDSVATTGPDAVFAAAVTAAKGVVAGVSALAAGGITDFVVLNLPDLGKIPAYAGSVLEALASSATTLFNTTLATELAEARASGLTILEVDIEGFFDALLADPGAFGVSDNLTPCLVPGATFCGLDAASDRVFFDPVHPGDTIHAEVAEIVGAAIAPVPLPATGLMLLAGLGTLGLLHRRIKRM